MSEKIKIYHVETQEDYDDLMIELEKQGNLWISGDKPTAKNCWLECREETVVCLNEVIEREMRFSSLGYTKREYPEIPVIKHKAKGVNQMEKVAVSQFAADWFEEHKSISLYKTLNRYLNNVGMSCELSQWQDSFGRSFKENVNAVVEVIAKMHLYGYEVEEKKYYWRKKKEHILEFETTVKFTYLNYGCITGDLFFSESDQTRNVKTKFTETEVRELVSEEDFNKLEKVEITE